MNGCKECGGTGWLTELVPSAEAYAWDSFGKKTIKGVYAGETPCMIEYAVKCPVCNGGTAIVTRRRKQANIPAAFYDADMSDFRWDIYEDDAGNKIDLAKQQLFVESFLQNFKEWQDSGIGLYIWSKTKGSGKTFLASAICNTLIKKYHIKSKFVATVNLVSLEKNASRDKYATTYESDPIKELCDCDLLVLDDLGQTASGGGWLEDILFRIFDTRMQKKAVTIVTSNRKMDAHNFDDRISDRMNDSLQPLPLPDYKVRSNNAKARKRTLLTKLGLMGNRGTPQPDPVQMELTT